jgi:hypothetical protein
LAGNSERLASGHPDRRNGLTCAGILCDSCARFWLRRTSAMTSDRAQRRTKSSSCGVFSCPPITEGNPATTVGARRG